ncbi:MAG: hypothetical protein JW737_08315 [Acidobacteria bacterium]|nr:hypothetical protein [Acidobacteriota bacterium]
METDVRKNPGLLKLDLYCKGLKIDDSCRADEDGRGIFRTRAGLGSGLEVILPDNLWTNIPVVEPFVKESPYVLKKEGKDYNIYMNGDFVCKINLPPQPKFYEKKTSNGVPMRRIGVLQGTYLGIYPTGVCEYWLQEPKVQCKFCSVGLNLGTDDEVEKRIQDVVETAVAAREEMGITYVHFNTGFYEGDSFMDQLEPFVKAVKKETGLLIGVQTPPHHDLNWYHRLRSIGVNQISFCFELWDKPSFDACCPGKSAHFGLERYLDAVEYCANIFDTTNGEIIAGLEPPEASIESIDWMTSVGAIPTVCIFRPLVGTEWEDKPSPKTEDMIPIFARMYDACVEHGLPMGIAPNIEVSIVMNPEQGRYLSEKPNAKPLNRIKMKLMGVAFRAWFKMYVSKFDRKNRKKYKEAAMPI